MHLFVFDIFVSLDMLSPIISTINKKKEKVFLININPVEKFSSKKTKLIDFLEQNTNFFYLNNNFLNSKFFLISLALKLYLFFLKNLTKKKNYKFWNFIFKSKFYLSESYFKKMITINRIVSISIAEDLPIEKQFFFKKLAVDFNIPLIMINVGINTKRVISKAKKVKPNYYLSSNKNTNHKKFSNTKSYLILGSLRYTKNWINNLKKIYLINRKNKNFTVVVFIKPDSSYTEEIENLVKRLTQNKINVITMSKPRSILNFDKEHIVLSSSEAIENSDLVIAHSSSIVVEASQRNKPILFPNYLKNFYKEDKNSIFQSKKFFYYSNSFEHTMKIINGIKLNKFKAHVDLKKFIQFLLGNQGENIKKNYVKFYKNLNYHK